MSIYRTPEDRASEAVTFRLTHDDKRLLDHLAQLQGVTLTDLFRSLLARRAKEMGVTALPPEAPRRKPGRPKKVFPDHRPSVIPATVDIRTGKTPPPEEATPVETTPTAAAEFTFGWLTGEFLEHSLDRAEGTRRDIASTIAFILEGIEGRPLIPDELEIKQISDAMLIEVRERIKSSSIRFPAKNLHLHYLRMILQWAARRPDLQMTIDPDGNLAPLTAKEVADAWPAPVKSH